MAFFELNIASSGLFAAQRGLQVTSYNITNTNTTGYSRQVLSQKASNPIGGLSVGMTGTGVTTTGVNRVRDSFIDAKIWAQNPKLGEYNIKVTQNSVVESAFGEPSDTGFTAVFNDLFSGISNLSTDPSSSANKTALKEQMSSFTKYYNNITSTLQNYQQNLNFDLKNTVNEINNLATRIQSLNDQIFQAELYGSEASSFRDERDNCLDQLSQLIDIEVTETEQQVGNNTVNKLTVKAAGQVLVDHTNYNTLQIKVRGEAEKKIDEKISELVNKYKEIDAETDADKKAVLQEEAETLKSQLKGLSDNILIAQNGSGGTEISFTCKDGNKIKLLSVDEDKTEPAEKYLIQSAGNGKLNSGDVDGLYDVVWSNGLPFDMSDSSLSGELKGIIDMRDGAGSKAENTYSGIPYYINRMSTYVQQFAKTMNEEYSKTSDGYIQIKNCSIDGQEASYLMKDSSGNMSFYGEVDGEKVLLGTFNENSKVPGYSTAYALFTYTTGSASGTPVSADELTDYSKMTAMNFSVSKEIYEDADNMRTLYDESNPSDTSFMLNLLGQKNNKQMFNEGDPKDYMVAIFAELGINAKQAEMYQGTQTAVVKNLTNQRLSVSQVDVTEEFTYLIQYQQAYQASAKIMNTIDGIYETTIFKLGNF